MDMPPPPKIANVMFSRGGGGLEQAFLDYNQALAASGYMPVPVISRGATIEQRLRRSSFEYHALSQWGWWDIRAARRLCKICRLRSVAALITHGRRAYSLARFATAIPLIAVAHNYNCVRFRKARAVIATTVHLKNYLVSQESVPDTVFVIPNIVHVTRPPPNSIQFHDPPMIGAMGRMVKKKGLEDLCAALALLKSRGIPVKAQIGGDGPERPALERTIRTLNLSDDVELKGWIDGPEAKDAFLQQIDIFCVPSRDEPFGIVLLEAWAAGKPVVTTNALGPKAIADVSNALIVESSNPGALAQSIETLLLQRETAYTLAVNGYNKVIADYAPSVLARRLDAVIRQVLP